MNEFIRQWDAKRKELEGLMRRTMPVKIGAMAKAHYQDNIRQEGFTDGGVKKWPKTKRQLSGGKSVAAGYGALQSSRMHLYDSIKYVPGDRRVKVSNDLVYAPVHNWGGAVNPIVTPKMRKFAWAKYYQAGGGRKKGVASAKIDGNVESQEAVKWKKLALTKKTKLSVKIPQRQFLGESRELNEKIAAKTETEIRNILNS